MNNIFRDDYSLVEIRNINCPLCDVQLECNAWDRWCSSSCHDCKIKYHFIKAETKYRLTDIYWNTRFGQRFWKGSKNNILFRNNYPAMEFEIESFDKETLLRLEGYVARRMELRKRKRK